jgi:hypothetical protein
MTLRFIPVDEPIICFNTMREVMARATSMKDLKMKTTTKTTRKPAVAKAKTAKPAAASAPKRSTSAYLLSMLTSPEGVTIAEAAARLGVIERSSSNAIYTLSQKPVWPQGHKLSGENVEGRGRVFRCVTAA